MRRRIWLVAALVLFGVAAFLMSRGDEPRPPVQPRVEFPRSLRPAEYERMERRRTLRQPEPVPEPSPDDAPPERRAPVLDPVLAALPSVPGKSAVVVEANALRHSPLGQLMLDCFLGAGEQGELDRMRERFGIDPLEDVDRIAFGGDDVLLVSGHFGGARWEELEPGLRFVPYGEKGRFVERESDGSGDVLAVWGDEMVLLADDRASLEEAIDRLEGRREATPAFDESSTYGEIYGVIAAAQLADLLPPDERGLRERLQEAADRIELHVDASGDVAIVADVEGPEPTSVRDLGKSLGAALSLARLKARADGEEALVDLLDHARVQPFGDRFALELALPLALLQEHLGEACRSREGSVHPPESETTE